MMKAVMHVRRARNMVLILIVLLAVSACAPDPKAEIVSPQLGAQLAARDAAGVVEAIPTPEPLRLANMSEEEITAGLPAEVVTALASANPANGESLSLANACIGCHALDPNQQMTGPTWFHVGDIAANRVPGESPALFLYNSIVTPNAFVEAGFAANVMPQNYGDTLDDQALADLLAYLLSQHE